MMDDKKILSQFEFLSHFLARHEKHILEEMIKKGMDISEFQFRKKISIFFSNIENIQKANKKDFESLSIKLSDKEMQWIKGGKKGGSFWEFATGVVLGEQLDKLNDAIANIGRKIGYWFGSSNDDVSSGIMNAW